MQRKSLMIHGCWVVAVLAAFGLGSLRRGPEPAESGNDGTMVGSKSSRSAAGVRDSDPGGGSLRGDARAGTPRRDGLLAGILGDSGPADGDWEALARQAIRDPNPIARRLAFTRLLESLTPENALSIREQLVAFGAEGEEWRDFNYRWGALAGKDAFAYAATSKERDLDAVLTGWASGNPSEALALLDNLPEELRGQRDRFSESVVAGLANRDQGLATDLVLRLAREGNGRADQLIEIVANETLRAGGLEDATRWSESLPDGSLKAAAMNQVANEYARQDPKAAAQWAQQFAAQDYAARAIEEVSDKWAERNPVAAVTWLESLPEGKGQVTGLRSVFGDWEDRDPVAAGEYLLSMPQSAQRDSAISGFATGYAWQDPQTAIAWAQDIGDPALRQESLTRAGQAFFRRDPNSARVWVESSGLPPAAREAILNPPTRRRQ